MFVLFFFTAAATTPIYTLSLHDALPIFAKIFYAFGLLETPEVSEAHRADLIGEYLDRKSTRLNSSHVSISYAVFCLKKKTKKSSLLRPLRPYAIPHNTPSILPSHRPYYS